MAERKSLINKPPSTPGEPQYNQGPDDALTRFFLGLIGDTSGVRPDPNGADWAGLAGGLATLLPIGRIIKMLPGLKPAQLERLVHDIGAGESVASRMARGGEGSLAEFKPLEGLGDESIAKAVRPRDPRADGGLPNQFVDVNFPPETPKPLYHGTKRDFKNFSTAKGDKADFLGNWLHFAEDPEHAARVPLEKELPTDAQGLVPAEYLDPAKRPRPDYMTEPMSEAKGLNIRPTMVSRSNQLDVTRTALSAKMIQDAEELLRHIPTKSWGRAFLGQAISQAKFYMRPDVIMKRGEKLGEILPDVAANLKDEMLRAVQNHPEAVKGAGFDALRYIDQPGWGENYSVAVPSAFQAKPALRKPEGPIPRNRGSVDEPFNGGLPKHRELVPPYRDKAGMAVDVLNDMQSRTKTHGGLSELQEFSDYLDGRPSASPQGFGSMIGYEGPSGLNNPAAGEAIKNPARFDPETPFLMEDDPVKYTAHLKSIDDAAYAATPEEMRKTQEIFGLDKPLEHPQMIDKLIKDLSDYFTTPKYDPFHPRSSKLFKYLSEDEK